LQAGQQHQLQCKKNTTVYLTLPPHCAATEEILFTYTFISIIFC